MLTDSKRTKLNYESNKSFSLSLQRNSTPVNSHNKVAQFSVVIAKGDSAASKHFIQSQDKHCLTHIRPHVGPPVQLPDSNVISTSEQGCLPLSPELSSDAKTGTVLPQLASSSLISLGQLCDDGCRVILNDKTLEAYKNQKLVLAGIRNRTDGLWDIPVYKTTMQEGNYKPPLLHGTIPSSPLSLRPPFPPLVILLRSVTPTGYQNLVFSLCFKTWNLS